MNYKNDYQDKQGAIEQLLPHYLPKKNMYQERVIEAMEYSLMAGGKRIRPIFLGEVYHLLGGSHLKIEAYQVALEMIHTYSLIHDDLPAMDNDDFRRGVPTCHIKFGEDMAILAGDGLLNQAFEVMLSDAIQQSDLVLLKVISEIAGAAGVQGMIGGQVADVLNEGKEITKECLEFIHLHKTGALISVSFAAGAMLAKASEEVIADFKKIGVLIGLAFQIQDDLLDVYGDPTLLGKPLMSDSKNGKSTYITLYGMDESKKKLDELFQSAISILNRYTSDENAFLFRFLQNLQTRNS